jgi:hypothetical protein
MRRLDSLRGVAIIAIVIATTGAAHADRKKRSTASILSGVGVGVSSAVTLSAFLVGDGTTYYGDWSPGRVNHTLLYAGLGSSVITPSLGQWYAGDYLTIGEGVRAASAAVALLALANGEETVRCDNIDNPNAMCKAFTKTGVALLGIAAIAYIGGAAYDVIDAPEAVDRYNQTHLTVVPTLGPPGAPSAGLAIAGRF